MAASRLTIRAPANEAWMRLDYPADPQQVVHLLASEDLTQWTSIATTIGPLVQYPDAACGQFSRRYYQIRLTDLADTNDWKNQINFPHDRLVSRIQELNQPRWIKFAVLTDKPTRVYYQDSTKYLFHYDFAAARLRPSKDLAGRNLTQHHFIPPIRRSSWAPCSSPPSIPSPITGFSWWVWIPIPPIPLPPYFNWSPPP